MKTRELGRSGLTVSASVGVQQGLLIRLRIQAHGREALDRQGDRDGADVENEAGRRLLRVEFQSRGDMKAYAASFTHLKTRGPTTLSPGDTHHGEGADDWSA
ncbi:MAG: hypothetical protein JWO24_1148 [Rhodospirillales bacterium]|jgi:hypothetical protein|nr:hypothetical protein [Rhodospirillales bacterium]